MYCIFTYIDLHLVDFYEINVGKYTSSSHGPYGHVFLSMGEKKTSAGKVRVFLFELVTPSVGVPSTQKKTSPMPPGGGPGNNPP